MVQGNITRFPYRNAATGAVEFVRTRGESSDGGLSGDGQGAGFWRNVRSPRPFPPVAAVSCLVLTAWFMLRQPTWNLLAMMCWDITYGLDVQDPNPQIWSEEIGEHSCHSTNCSNWTKTLWRPFQHFHVH